MITLFSRSVLGGEMQNCIKPILAFSIRVGPPAQPSCVSEASLVYFFTVELGWEALQGFQGFRVFILGLFYYIRVLVSVRSEG